MDKVGLQLFSFGFDSDLSLIGKIKATAEMGFTGVEFARGYDDIAAEDLKKALEEAGVTAKSAHVSLDFMEKDIPYLAKVGVKWAICPMAPFNTVEEAKELAEDLNRYGKLAAQHGMKVGYHNHTDEFLEIDGKYLMDWLIESTDPETVMIELDCGWASAAGVDPVAYINKHSGRIGGIHIKENGDVIGVNPPRSRHDTSPRPKIKFDENGKPIIPEEFKKLLAEHERINVAQGTGIIDWKAVKAAADAQCDNVVYVVEREANYGGKERVECIKEDIAWIKANL